MENTKFDNVSNPKHYTGSTSLECINVMEVIFGKKAVAYFCLCNAFKYMWRYKNKNGEEDLSKAKWYLNRVKNFYIGNLSNEDNTIFIAWERLNSLLETIM